MTVYPDDKAIVSTAEQKQASVAE